MSAPPTTGGTSPPGFNAAALRRAAKAGVAAAMSQLAICYTTGTGGVDVDLVEAFQWKKRAVKMPAPSDEAYFNLALCYQFGRGTSRDPVEATRLYTIAAKMGHVTAQYNLGMRMQRGEGTAYDPVGAFTWLKRAADAGNAMAQCNVGHALEKGVGVGEDLPASVAYYRRAADQGDAKAMFNLGICNARGIGVPRDPSVAVLWLKRAHNAGYEDARSNMFWFTASLSPPEVHAMGAGILRALLDGMGLPATQGAEKPELVARVLALRGICKRGG